MKSYELSEGKRRFLEHYREELIRRYDWAKRDKARLDKFVQSCEDTLSGKAETWSWKGGAVDAAYRLAGGTGKLTWKVLKEL